MAYTLAGRQLRIVKEPLERGGLTYLPVKEIAEEIGARADWDNDAKRARLSLGNQTVELDMASETVHVDGQPVRLSGPVFVLDGIMYVPSDFFDKVYGYPVHVEGNEVRLG